LGRAVRRLDDLDPVQHPGEPSSVATTFDGHPMAKQGKAVEALAFAFLSPDSGRWSASS
jgi:TctA family transporter